jgi:signal transduction histidine kinase
MLVVALVGVAVCWAVWRMRIAAIDAELRGRIARVAASVRPGSGGAFDLELPADAIAFFQQAGTSAYYAVWSPDGTPVDRSDPRTGQGVPMPGARTHRGYREVVQAADGFTILIGRNIDDLRGELWSLATTMGAAGAGALGLAVLCAWIVAGRALAPVQRIGETAQRMARGELTARIPVEQTESELGQLASALNLAFDRLHETIDRQRRLTADASHELRTPVAMLSAEVEWALMRARSAGEYPRRSTRAAAWRPACGRWWTGCSRSRGPIARRCRSAVTSSGSTKSWRTPRPRWRRSRAIGRSPSVPTRPR